MHHIAHFLKRTTSTISTHVQVRYITFVFCFVHILFGMCLCFPYERWKSKSTAGPQPLPPHPYPFHTSKISIFSSLGTINLGCFFNIYFSSKKMKSVEERKHHISVFSCRIYSQKKWRKKTY